MTWDQVELFAEKAGDRLAHDTVREANVLTMGIGAALGDAKPLKEMAASLGVEQPKGRRKKTDDGGFGKLVSQVSSFGGVRVKRGGGVDGADSRGAGSRAGAKHKRVPRPASARRNSP